MYSDTGEKVLELSEGKAKVDFNGNTVDVNTGLARTAGRSVCAGPRRMRHRGQLKKHDKAQELMELFTELEELQ